MATRKTSSGQKGSSKKKPAGTDSSRSKRKSGKSAGTGQSRKNAVLRLSEVAQDVATLATDLGRHDVTVPAAPGSGGESGGVPAKTQRRLELLALLLEKQTHELNGEADVPASVPIPRNAIAFSWLPELDIDNNSVSIGVPGVGEASIGSDGASVSVDGVGGASVGAGGVSVNAGGTSVSVGTGGAEVSVPGAGTVRVGPDGSVSVGPSSGASNGGGPSLPGLPIPSLCATEFKIPIPVPRFVVEPFEIPVSVPKLEPSPLPISIPSPTLEPNPVPIPYPTFDFNLGSPHLGDLSMFDSVMDIAAAEMLERMMGDVKGMLKKMARDLSDRDDDAGSPDQTRVAKITQLAEIVWGRVSAVRDHYQTLRNLVMQSPVVVSAALISAWQQFQALVVSLFDYLDELLETAGKLISPADAVVAMVRTIYLIIGWILARIVRGSIKLGDALTGRLLQMGSRLHAMT